MLDDAKPDDAQLDDPKPEDAKSDEAKSDDDSPAPLPAPMWAPFALLGTVAAFFCVLGLAAIMRDARYTLPAPAVLTGGVVGALAGVILRRWRRLHNPWLPPERQRALIGLVVGVAGASIGGVVAWCSAAFWSSANRWAEAGFGALTGAACSILFLPGAVFMVNAASRATRARNGSIVAGADRRSIWSTTFAAVAVAPVVAVPATAVGLVSFSIGRVFQPALVVGATTLATCALVVLELLEVRARRQLDRVVSTIDELEPARDVDHGVANAHDLGLGDIAFSRLTMRDAYRGARHAQVALRGDPDEAREALVDAHARRRRTRTLGILAFAAALPAVHALAASVERLDVDWDASGVSGVFGLELQNR